MRFMEWLQLTGKLFHGNNYLWSVMKKSSVSRTRRFMYFQILCYVLERWIRTQHQILLGKKNWVGSRVHHNTELWTQLMVSRWNSSGIFSQDSLHCSSATKSKSSCLKWAIHQNSKDGSIFGAWVERPEKIQKSTRLEKMAWNLDTTPQET